MSSLSLVRCQAVIFDLDGLVLDTEPTYRIAWELTAADMGFAFADGFFEDLSGLQHSDVAAALRAVVGDAFPLERFWDASVRHWQRHVQVHGLAVKAGVAELLAQLQRNALPHALATNSPRGYALCCLELAGLAEAFPCMVCRDDVARGKPEPDVFLEAAARLGVLPEQCLVLEDSLTGLAAARSAGMTALLVNDSVRVRAEAARLEIAVLDSLHDVPAWLEGAGSDA